MAIGQESNRNSVEQIEFNEYYTLSLWQPTESNHEDPRAQEATSRPYPPAPRTSRKPLASTLGTNSWGAE